MADRSIHLAHAEIHDTVRLEHKAPASVRARDGESLRLRFSYRFTDAADRDETWHFRMTYRIDNGPPVVKEAFHDDVGARVDDTTSNLHDDVTFPSGDHVLHYSIEAGLSSLARKGEAPSDKSVRALEGSVPVTAD